MKKEDVKNKKNGCGKCIFCLSKCSNCGSANVNVSYRPVLEYCYDGEESIDFDFFDEWIQVRCEDCDHMHETDTSLLMDTISEILNLNGNIVVRRKDDRTIEVERYRSVLVER